MGILNENNPNSECSSKLKRGVNDISSYKEILWAKQLQARHSNPDGFFKKKGDNYLGNKPQPVPISNSLKPFFIHYTDFVWILKTF
jgi:hypothetical protein